MVPAITRNTRTARAGLDTVLALALFAAGLLSVAVLLSALLAG